jgi:gas vesicle protein
MNIVEQVYGVYNTVKNGFDDVKYKVNSNIVDYHLFSVSYVFIGITSLVLAYATLLDNGGDESDSGKSATSYLPSFLGEKKEGEEGLGTSIVEQAGDAISDIQEKGSELFEDIQEKGSELVEDIQEKGSELVEDIQEKGSELVEDFQEKGGDLLEGMRKTEKISGGSGGSGSSSSSSGNKKSRRKKHKKCYRSKTNKNK